MQIDAFWQHWQVTEDPFRAEEAREDPVLGRIMDQHTTHPEFEKIYGRSDRPTTAVVFGEKGSGKTALRLQLERRIYQYNASNPDGRIWVTRYDDLNGVLDRFANHAAGRRDTLALLETFRLADHQDAILSLTVTQLVDALLGRDESSLGPQPHKTARRMGRSRRMDLAVLAAIYDQPRTGNVAARWGRLRRMLALGWMSLLSMVKWLGVVMAVVTAALLLFGTFGQPQQFQHKLLTSICAASAVLLLGGWLWRYMNLWLLGRRVRREVRVVDRQADQLRAMLSELPLREIPLNDLPTMGNLDSRYQLTTRLLDVLAAFGYRSLVVLADRIDEPAMINGDAEKMRALIWPMFNNKFLQQDRFGIKLLLPIELRHMLRREGAEFFQQARLDKQHMIDRLTWSGATLYDLCSTRLQACRPDGAEPITLADLFDDDVTRQDVIDALDQMLQPRDAMKFIYRVVQEHCQNVPQDEPMWRIPRLVLSQVRKEQAQRLQDFSRGLSPA